MKLPLIFKQPQYKKFHYEPRYYDPIKEEIREKTEMFKKMKENGEDEYVHSSISQAFARRSRVRRQGNAMSFVFIVAFVLIALSYIFYGNMALWAFFIILPIYIFIKLRRRI